jgi:4-diphosphocytidyl-2-C-methyl-D-erythritol kinase
VGLKYPQILEIKAMLYSHGAVYASMTGSGSVVYGLFHQIPNLPGNKGWKTITITL